MLLLDAKEGKEKEEK